MKPILIKYLDLCCGIGGFRIGINNYQKKQKKYKFECVSSIDIKTDAIITYNANFNENIVKTDIYDIDTFPKFDMLCVGFPCQPFSSAGKKEGFSDKRGGIIFKICDICEKYEPSYIILENVSNLIKLKNGEYIKKIVNMFERIGYNIFYRKLNSKNFGISQDRERVFIVGLRNKNIDIFADMKFQKNPLLKSVIDISAKYTDINKEFAEKILKYHNSVTNIFGYKIQDKRGGSRNIHSWDIGYNGDINRDEIQLMNKIMTERRKKHWAKKKRIIWMDGMPLTYKEIKTFYSHPKLKSMLSHLVDLKYLKMEKPKDLIDGKRIYVENGEIGYNICKGKLSFPISRILDPNHISPTLTATDSDKLAVIIDDKYVRKLTDEELKLLSGFPINYIIPKNVNKYDLFGNTVCPKIITNILESIFPI